MEFDQQCIKFCNGVDQQYVKFCNGVQQTYKILYEVDQLYIKFYMVFNNYI